MDLFLQIFDDGTLTDSQGWKCDFCNSVILLTSNLGAGAPVKKRMGFGMMDEAGEQDEAVGAHAARATAEEAIRKHLRPELVNRLTKIVNFQPLGREVAGEILEKLLDDLNQRLADRGVRVECSEEVKVILLQEGYSERYGARNLERVVDQKLGSLIAAELLRGENVAANVMRIEVNQGGFFLM